MGFGMIIFSNSREWYDREHRVAFVGHDDGEQVVFYVSQQALEAEFGLTSTKDARRDK